MKFNKIITDEKAHNKTGGKLQPAKAIVTTNTFTLNSMALVELAEIHGGDNFALELYVSECCNYVAFGTKPQEKKLMSTPKTISSAEAMKMLNFDRPWGKRHIFLTVKDNLLVGCVNDTDSAE